VSAIRPCELPEAALLRRYLNSGAYADCFVTELAVTVSQADFIEAFYTTPLFKLERLLLGWFVARPSTDLQARALAEGTATSFAAWSVEGRTPEQLLMCDFVGRTRSWLMIAAGSTPGSTRLYFGSAVVPQVDARTGARRMGSGFRALLGFHKLYSRALLWSAMRRVLSRAKA
jgi:hypothetical protein